MTQLLYIIQPELFQTTAQLQSIQQTEKGLILILDQTNFYPQGGGQPGDTGTIKTETGTYSIVKTIMGEENQAYHLVGEIEGEVQPNQLAVLTVDSKSRYINSRNHSAGHLIDLAITNSGFSWKPGKGYHFPDGCYVEYETSQDPTITNELIAKIQREFDVLTAKNLEVHIQIDPTQMHHNQPLRTIGFNGFPPCPCGGTHVRNTSELSGYTITKMKYKNGIIKVSYALTDHCYLE
jgi:Ser-tRNA(Ala) deacylase AlaX